jgi:hypothetical protein
MQRGELLRNRKFQILIGLLLLLLIVNAAEWGEKRGTTTQQIKKGSHLADKTAEDPILLAEKLTEGRTEFQQEKRNIFTFFHGSSGGNGSPQNETEMAQAQPVAPPEPVCGHGVCEDGEDLENCSNDCQPPPPPPPVITLRYIGFVSEGENPVAFLTDGKEVFVGRVNDVIANQYKVLKITEDNVELEVLASKQSSTIRFQGNQGG